MAYFPCFVKGTWEPSSGKSSQFLVKKKKSPPEFSLRFTVLFSQRLHHSITLQKQYYDAESSYYGSLPTTAHNPA